MNIYIMNDYLRVSQVFRYDNRVFRAEELRQDTIDDY